VVGRRGEGRGGEREGEGEGEGERARARTGSGVGGRGRRGAGGTGVGAQETEQWRKRARSAASEESGADRRLAPGLAPPAPAEPCAASRPASSMLKRTELPAGCCAQHHNMVTAVTALGSGGTRRVTVHERRCARRESGRSQRALLARRAPMRGLRSGQARAGTAPLEGTHAAPSRRSRPKAPDDADDDFIAERGALPADRGTSPSGGTADGAVPRGASMGDA
jgi:hypothetical protein